HLPPSSTLFPYTTLFRSCQPPDRCLSGTGRPVVLEFRVVFQAQRPRSSDGGENAILFGGGSAAVAGRRGRGAPGRTRARPGDHRDRKSTRLNSSHGSISY